MTNKKRYKAPEIIEHSLDKDISLVMESPSDWNDLDDGDGDPFATGASQANGTSSSFEENRFEENGFK
ncbi:hypothetical protein [Carboxylicivirga marina]|uniref:Uncharacterized protein n=1 Tax=Carboxylicivirga marina TaxID=2800988 RepID=A0ABS1HKX4_9BACT|nr:hypothetical protein [Carboxylicivirga marina]MBK3518318.1 hypothetical protein [Carboxylicivirga marina]